MPDHVGQSIMCRARIRPGRRREFVPPGGAFSPGCRQTASENRPLGDNGRVTVTRIREFRSQRGLTVRQLADQAGVSTGLISQVERGVTDPSLETMRRIAEVLEVPLFSLFQQPEEESVAVIRRADRYRISSPHHAIAYTRASPGGAKLEVLEGVLEPGGVSADEPRSHPSEECVVVLDGQLTVQVGEQTHVLAAGDSCHFDSSIPHRFRNDGPATARFLVSVTPPSY